MNIVTVNTAKAYEIKIGSGLLSTLGWEAAALKGVQTVCLVSESTVFPHYGKAALEALEESGLKTVSYVFPSGEASKNGATYLDLLNFLAQNRLTRSDLIVALGGGVVGDLAGFAAATYLRGIRLIQVPTTLLSCVDSSVGGKTAIDLPAGKNLAGAFYQPDLVLCDTDTLDTLPREIFREGCSEAIKYGILYDPELFAHLEEKGLDFDREAVITKCVRWKGNAVEADEQDTGARMKLNLGHTLGHGVEKSSHFAVSHGKAVAIGTAIITRSACSLGICDIQTRDRILGILERFGLPISTSFPPEALLDAALSDKKRAGDTIRLIVPRAIGDCRILPVTVDDLGKILQAGY